MNLYLVQHAEAVSKEEDPQRPLSATGTADIKKIAEFAAEHCHIAADSVFHSGKLRARQTADLLATALGLKAASRADGLEPLADPLIWAARLQESTEDMMLVGHLPHMGRLAAALLCGDPEAGTAHFQMGGIVALKRQDNKWSLQWMIVPAIMPAKKQS